MSSRMRVSACALLLLLAGAAHAEDQGFYFGLSLGLAQYDFGPPEGEFGSVTQLWPPEDDDQSQAFGLSAGYRINRYLAVEASYVNLGTLEATRRVTFSPHPGGSAITDVKLETTGPALTAFGILPVSDSWELFVRAGMLFADSERTTGFGDAHSFNSEAPILGLGVQYDWKGPWSARLELQRSFGIGGGDASNEADVDAILLTGVFRL